MKTPLSLAAIVISSTLIGVTPVLAQTNDLSTLLRTEGSAAAPRISTAQLLAAPENAALRDLLISPPQDLNAYAGKRIAVLSSDGVEEIELTGTIDYFRKRGASVDLIAPPRPAFPDFYGVQIPEIRASHILTIRYMETGGWVRFDRLLNDARPDDYDAVIIPGGAWNPDSLRADPHVLGFVNAVAARGRVVASLCHGPWVLADAGLLRGKRATAWGPMRKDLENAGATYVDEAVVVDGNLITSRGPVDLAAFLTAIGTAITAR